MSEMKNLTVQKREALGKGPNRRLRVESLVPGVFYASDGTNVLVQMATNVFNKMYDRVGRTNVFNLEIDDNGSKNMYPVFIWDAQYHPVKGTFTHVDFFGVDLNKEIQINVRLRFTGTSIGVKAGGHMDVYREEVALMAKPQDMPRIVDVDITDMGINTTLRASALKLPAGVKVVYKNDFPILSVTSNVKVVEEDGAK